MKLILCLNRRWIHGNNCSRNGKSVSKMGSEFQSFNPVTKNDRNPNSAFERGTAGVGATCSSAIFSETRVSQEQRELD